MVSVIIPVYNRAHELENLFNDIACQKRSEPIEVVVIDDGSIFRSEQICKTAPLPVKYLYKKHGGPAAARNLGVKHSRGEILWFLDADVRLENNEICQNLKQYLENHSDVGSIGGEYAPSGQYSLKYILKNGETYTQWHAELKGILTETDYIATSNCMMRRTDFDSAGGFSEKFEFYAEDKMLGHSLKERGLRNIVLKNGAVLHYFSQTERRNDFYLKHLARIYFAHWSLGKNLAKLVFLDFYYYIFMHKKLLSKENIAKRGGSKAALIIKFIFGMIKAYYESVKHHS